MSTISSPPSSTPNNHHIPTATLALPSASATTSRRLPPPCWSPEETTALIESYRLKWYSLNRGNLRQHHWQEVADDVASRCPVATPKTAVQCRHKMEKLRKRYRGEIQRAAAHGGVKRFSSSSWAHFQIMHDMEKKPNNNTTTPPSSDDDDDAEEESNDFKNSVKRINNLYNYNRNRKGILGNQGAIQNGFRIKIPGQVNSAPAAAKVYSKIDEIGRSQYPTNPNPRFANSDASGYGAGFNKVLRDGFLGRGEMGKRVSDVSCNSKKRKEDDGVSEVVEAIQALGEGFMRIEKVKMDVARQVEEMRMEMELKRTEMILESQQRIVEAFAKAVSERSVKAAKRMPTAPDC